MKVFEFDHTTGLRGKQIGNIDVMDYTDVLLSNAITTGRVEAIDFVQPTGSATQEINVHVEAGRGDRVYNHPTKWICFCFGSFQIDDREVWQWVVLPPKAALTFIAQCECCGSAGRDLKGVQMGDGVDMLCQGCIENEIGSECSR